MNTEINTQIPDELIMNKIYFIRGVKVMLDRDLAELYAIETKVLKQTVRRHLNRFPEDFMFELSKDELDDWRRQFGTSNKEIMGLRIPPFAFTEYGVIMLASVLNSKRAIEINIQIVRIFTRMREMLSSNKDILKQIDLLKKHLTKHEGHFRAIFNFLEKMVASEIQQEEQQDRKRVGFKRKDEG